MASYAFCGMSNGENTTADQQILCRTVSIAAAIRRESAAAAAAADPFRISVNSASARFEPCLPDQTLSTHTSAEI